MIDSAAFLVRSSAVGQRWAQGVEGCRRLGVPERPPDGHHIATGGDEAGGVEMPQVVELDASEVGVAQRLAPPVADGVLVRRATELRQRNLTSSTDWIVLNVTMDVLTGWARHDPPLAGWLTRGLER